MPTNDFQIWDPNSVNIESQATYLTDTARLNGVSSGTASSSLANKVWRQASAIAAMIAQFIVNQTGQNAVDDGTDATLLANFTTAVLNTGKNVSIYKNIAGVQNVSLNGAAFTTTGATTFAAPASGIAYYRIWGAGGGSGGTTGVNSAAFGGGGGEYVEGIISGLTTATTVTCGLPGTAGAGGGSPTNGGNGGTTSFGTITALGGLGGFAGNAAPAPAGSGLGGNGGVGGQFRVGGGSASGPFSIGSPNVVTSQGGMSWSTPVANFGATGSSANGIAGNIPGGGAAGSAAAAVGAIGGTGMVILMW